MKIAFSQVCRDYLALRGESPDLLPLLEEGEESAVLTLSRELATRLEEAAVEATLSTPTVFLDEIRTVEAECESDTFGRRPAVIIRVPSDYLKLCSLQMADWAEPLREVEPTDSLRWALGGDAPEWMICPKRPMIREERDAKGVFLRVYGSQAADLSARLTYVPAPVFDGETLTVSRSAYLRALSSLIR